MTQNLKCLFLFINTVVIFALLCKPKKRCNSYYAGFGKYRGKVNLPQQYGKHMLFSMRTFLNIFSYVLGASLNKLSTNHNFGDLKIFNYTFSGEN